MAGFVFFIAPPVVGGLGLSPIVQSIMRGLGLGLTERVAIELGMVGAGLYALHWGRVSSVKDIPFVDGNAGNGFAGTNWFAFYGSTTLVTTGVLTLCWGVLINIVLEFMSLFS
jgi:hypothetical protein